MDEERLLSEEKVKSPKKFDFFKIFDVKVFDYTVGQLMLFATMVFISFIAYLYYHYLRVKAT